jgi:two-component system sensor histidine kinase QseC
MVERRPHTRSPARVSVTQRLLLSLTITVVVLGAASTWQLYRHSREDVGRVLDAQLLEAAQLALSLVISRGLAEDGADRPAVLPPPVILPLRQEYGRELVFQVMVAGQMVARSARAPVEPLSTRRQGFDRVSVAAVRWRVYVLTDAGAGVTVQVARSERERGMLQSSFARDLIRFVPLYLLPLIALIWFDVRRGLRPLEQLRSAVAGRRPGELTPIPRSAVPREVDAVVEALNRTFAELEASLERERNVLSQAAHELRTPLTVLYAQTERLLAARDAEQQRQAAVRIASGIRSTQRLIDQLLSMAALDSGSAKGVFRPVDLHCLCEQVLAEMAPAAMDSGIEVSLTGVNGPVLVRGDETALILLVRNLVDNGIKYTPAGGTVTVALSRAGSCVRLEVSDTGPGVPESQRERIFQPFHRIHGDQPGSGLGMAIARRVVDLHRGNIELAAGGAGGARFLVSLAAAPER